MIFNQKSSSSIKVQKILTLIGGMVILALGVAVFLPGAALADGGYYYGQPYGDYYDYGYDQPYYDGGYRKPLSPVGWPVATYRSRSSRYYDYDYDYGRSYYPGDYGYYSYGGYDDCYYGDCGYYSSSSYSSSYSRSYRSYRPSPSYYGDCYGGRCSPVNVNVYCDGGKCGQPGYYYDYRGKPWGKG